MQKSAAFLMVTVLVLGLFLMGESRQSATVRMIESSFADWTATNTARSVPQSHVVLVEINDSSLGGDNAWPWSPLPFSLFLQGLQSKPDVVAVEPVLNWEDTSLRGTALLKQQQSQKVLHDLILKTPKIILGSRLGFPADPDVVPPKLPAPFLRNVNGDMSKIPVFTDIEAQSADDYRLTAAVGFVNPVSSAGGGLEHKAPLVFSYRGEIVPSLALQALIQWFKLTPDDVVVEPGKGITLGKACFIPIDAAGRMNVDFDSPFTRFGYDDLLLAVEQQQEKQKPAIPLDALKGSIALLARTDKASRTLTFPSGQQGSPGELCARAIATVQNKAFAHRVSRVFDFAVIAVMMAASCFFYRFSKRTVLVVSFTALLGYLFLSMTVYASALLWLPLVLPLGLLFLVNFFSFFTARVIPAAPAGSESKSKSLSLS